MMDKSLFPKSLIETIVLNVLIVKCKVTTFSDQKEAGMTESEIQAFISNMQEILADLAQAS